MSAPSTPTRRSASTLSVISAASTHLDSLYFLRGQTDTEQYLETFYYELDPQFSTNADFKVAKILANDMLSVYLMGELESLENTNHRNMVLPLPEVRPTWQDSKTDLTELIYLLDSKGCFGNVPLTQLAIYIANAFNVHLDMNLSRTFCDMKIRNNPTPWLDKAKEACSNGCRRGGETRKTTIPSKTRLTDVSFILQCNNNQHFNAAKIRGRTSFVTLREHPYSHPYEGGYGCFVSYCTLPTVL